MADQQSGVESAITALASTVYGIGSVKVKIAACYALGKYVPHPSAVRALTSVLYGIGPDDLKVAAAEALGKKN